MCVGVVGVIGWLVPRGLRLWSVRNVWLLWFVWCIVGVVGVVGVVRLLLWLLLLTGQLELLPVW